MDSCYVVMLRDDDQHEGPDSVWTDPAQAEARCAYLNRRWRTMHYIVQECPFNPPEVKP